LEFEQESESKTFKCFGVRVNSVKAGAESESNISDSVHLWYPEVGPDPDCRSRLQEDSAFFFQTRIRSQTFRKKLDAVSSEIYDPVRTFARLLKRSLWPLRI